MVDLDWRLVEMSYMDSLVVVVVVVVFERC